MPKMQVSVEPPSVLLVKFTRATMSPRLKSWTLAEIIFSCSVVYLGRCADFKDPAANRWSQSTFKLK